MVPIRVGISDGTVTELVEGSVQAGDHVVVDASDGTDTNRNVPGRSPFGGPGGGGFRRFF
jgi:hypothetical protein